jgi:hypothetical protein
LISDVNLTGARDTQIDGQTLITWNASQARSLSSAKRSPGGLAFDYNDQDAPDDSVSA